MRRHNLEKSNAFLEKLMWRETSTLAFKEQIQKRSRFNGGFIVGKEICYMRERTLVIMISRGSCLQKLPSLSYFVSLFLRVLRFSLSVRFFIHNVYFHLCFSTLGTHSTAQVQHSSKVKRMRRAVGNCRNAKWILSVYIHSVQTCDMLFTFSCDVWVCVWLIDK